MDYEPFFHSFWREWCLIALPLYLLIHDPKTQQIPKLNWIKVCVIKPNQKAKIKMAHSYISQMMVFLGFLIIIDYEVK